MSGPSDDTGAVLHKHRRRRDFTQTQNATIRDAGMSLKATGLLVYLLSLPDGSSVGSREISARKPDGRHSVMTAFRELKELGYVEQSRVRGTNGKFVTITHVHEVSPGAKTEPGPGAVTQPGAWRENPTPENRAASSTKRNTNIKDTGSVIRCGGCGTDVPLAEVLEHELLCDGCVDTEAAS